jgi:glycosyltransferase involved in cell wall biosynthesis
LVLNEIPSLRLLIVGIGELPAKFAGIMNTRNIELIGEVNDLKPWYQKSAVSVVPLLTGSGTRLKVLEAMGMGVPVISTKKGAEGIDYSEGKNIVIADEENTFAKQIITLLQDKNKKMEIAEQAKALVKQKYDWNIIGNNMANSIKVILSKNEK